jgi:hypothetical protein
VPPEYNKYLKWLEEQKKEQPPPVIRAAKDGVGIVKWALDDAAHRQEDPQYQSNILKARFGTDFKK